MPDLILVHGTLRKSTPCWKLETESGESLFVVGDLSKVHDGEVVVATGQPTDQGFCGPGRTLLLHWIGSKVGGADALPKSVIRDVSVKVTFSSMDLNPRFRLEGKPLGLTADGPLWVGYFPGVSVTGKLDVYVESGAWDFQKFTLNVEATDPATGKTYKSDFPPVREKKGYVLLQKTLDVGAGE
jgi:hypothetical protein